jgi:hypothetical protein
MLRMRIYGVALGALTLIAPAFLDDGASARTRSRHAWTTTAYSWVYRCKPHGRYQVCKYYPVPSEFRFSASSAAKGSIALTTGSNNRPGNPGNAKPVGNAGESPNGRDFAFPPGIRGFSDSPSKGGGGSSGGASFSAGASGFAGGNPGVGPGGGGAPGLSGGGGGHGK